MWTPNTESRSRRPRVGVVGGVLFAALLAGLVGTDGCDKEGLLIVALTATPADASLGTVIVEVGSVTRQFLVAGGLSATPVSFGIYVPSGDLGSNVIVDATATSPDGGRCYRGMTNVAISAGATVQAAIDLKAQKSCGAVTGAAGEGAAGTSATDGGAGATGAAGSTVGTGGLGMAGSMGTGGTVVQPAGMAGSSGGTGPDGGAAGAGMAGSGGLAGMGGMPGQILGPPSLTKCTEYFHVAATSCNTSSANADVFLWDVAFSADGTRLATAGGDGEIVIWKMTGATPSKLTSLSTSGQAYIAFSPDGKLFVEGSNLGELKLYDATSFTLMGSLKGNSDDIEGIGFTSDSKHVWAIDYSGVLTRHDIGGGMAAAATVTTGGAGYTLGLSPIATATTQWIGVGFEDGSGYIANVAPGTTTPTTITVSADGFGTYAMAFSPDGARMVAGGSDGFVSFWTIPPPANGASSGATITIPDSTNTPIEVNGIKYSPDGKTLVITTGESDLEYKMAIVDATTRKVISTKVPTFAPLGVAWSPSGTIVVAGEDTCGKFIVCSDN